jgi:geranylgeranyl diphosphate synthase, type II
MEAIEFGGHLGIAFQIVDDILNLTADESKYGKEILGDLYEGKRTLMVIHLLQTSNASDKTKLVDLLSRPRQNKTASEMKWIFEKMQDSGSIDYARRVAAQHSGLAMDRFSKMTLSSPETAALEQTRSLLEYLTSRDY